ncbi:septal ring lytic transglycosylase RlpA family protein [Prosthecochloris aestuarii]|nr:septal ring lytic transglycosylase RlpA family protein [Prosthecochloris aestuarii]
MKTRRIPFLPLIMVIMLAQLTGCQTSSTYTSLQSGIPVTGLSPACDQTPDPKDNELSCDENAEDLGTLCMVIEGKASYYADRFHGRLTANGERFNMHEMTAAHKSLPFGSMVRVTNLTNGKKVVVRINDRGPYIKGRIIDLSKGAAKEIGLIKKGVSKVKLEVYDGSDTGESQTS